MDDTKRLKLPTEFSLMAIEPLPFGQKWKSEVESILRRMSSTSTPSGAGLFASTERHAFWDLEFSDGFQLERFWLASGKSALSIRGVRKYFLAGTNRTLNQAEREILAGRQRPAGRSTGDQLIAERDLLLSISSAMTSQPNFVELNPLFTDEEQLLSVQLNDATFDMALQSIANEYRRFGFHQVPENFTVTLCPLDGCENSVAAEFERRLYSTARSFHTKIEVRTTDFKTVKSQLQKIVGSVQTPRPGRCVLFLFPSNEKPASKTAMDIFSLAESVRAPFRRAYATDRKEFSIPNQFPSLLTAAGGIPHQANSGVRKDNIWTLGVDLSHRSAETKSILAVTLVSPDGMLKAAWTSSYPRLDETVHFDALAKILKSCKDVLATGGFEGGIVVLRDGRTFENENINTYSEVLDLSVTYLEIRKRPNIQVFKNYGLGLGVSAPWAGVVCGGTEQSGTALILSTTKVKSPDRLPRYFKVYWDSERNGLNLSPNEIAKILISSAVAPGLGSQPHYLPSALYWADGIAGASDTDLRFRGNSNVRI